MLVATSWQGPSDNLSKEIVSKVMLVATDRDQTGRGGALALIRAQKSNSREERTLRRALLTLQQLQTL